jgi:flagellar hook-length control protein FliK
MIDKVQGSPKNVQNVKDNKETDSSKDSDIFATLLSGIMGQNINCLGNKTDGEAEPALLTEADNIKGLGSAFADCIDQMQIMDNPSAVGEEAILGDESLDAEQNIETQYGLTQPSIDGEKGKLFEPPYIDLNLNTDNSIALNTEPDAAVENKPNGKPSKLNNSLDDALHNTELEVTKGKDDIKDFVVPRAEFLKILNSNQNMKSSRTKAAYELETGLPMTKDDAVDAGTKEKPIDQLNLGKGAKDKYNDYAEAEADTGVEVKVGENLDIGKKEEQKNAKDKLNMINAKHISTNEDSNSISQSQGTKNYDKVSQNVSFDKSNVMDQIYDKIRSETGKDYSELHVKLKPEELGDVAIKLVMEKGVLTAKILVEDTLVKAMIESNLPDLKEQLKSQNINVSDFSVSLNLENDELLNKGFQNGNQNHSRNARGMVYGKHKKGIPVGSNEDILTRDVRSIIDGNLNMLV